ncbi:molecular chaperone SurA [Luteimonas chenhongjianii]|uniref:Chaperone SurA n=1 Tax=Luteimonas chenhongjianii TaxID=2006110 RepID=A0A290XD21_9GAMM|nr:peptidylprolyl isomerase [Luteimonas chenhongjianii]ATD67020.1 molecular chaperone SurA [Luteimonas chenhongjianii]
MKTFILSLAAAAALFAASASAQDLQPLDRIAAVVDEDVILASELERAVANIRGQYATRQDQLPPQDILERQVLERLITLRLQTATAQRTGVRVSDQDVDQAIAAIAQQNNFTIDQLRRQLAGDGMSFDDFRDSLRDELLIQRMRQRFAQTRISVSDAEVEAALSAQATGAQYRLAHILVALPEGATPEQIQTGQQKIDGIKSLLDRNEMEFSAAAVRYSDSPNALEGGDLGWRRADEIPAAFATAVTDLQPGQIIGPIRGPSGFQLLQLVDRRDAAQSSGAGSVTEFQARHILLRAQPGDDAAAKARADSLRARIVGGADFAELARENSDDASTKASGGDLGWFTQDQFGPDFGSQVAAIGDGDVSQPFRTQAGWHIVQRQATRQTAGNADNRRAQVREAIGQRKLEDEWDRYVRELRGEAYVSVRVGPNRDPEIGG